MGNVKKVRNKSKNVKDENALVSKGLEAKDEALEVADLSKVDAPEIEFEMPAAYASEPISKKKKNSLTSELLNREIIALRAPIQQAIRFVSQKLMRKKKFLMQCNAKKEDPKVVKKIENIDAEILKLKTVKKDDMAKFALMNDEKRDKLMSKAKTVDERIMYSIVFEKPVVKRIEEYHTTYTDWKTSAPYFLQRLGLQHKPFQAETLSNADINSEEFELANANRIPVGKRVPSQDSEEKSDNAEGAEETDESDTESRDDDNAEESSEGVESSDEVDGNDDEAIDDEEVSDVDMGTDSEDDSEKAAMRRSLLLGLAGVKEDKTRRKLTPKKRSLVETDEEDFGDSDEDDTQEDVVVKPTQAQPSKKTKVVKPAEKETKNKLKKATDAPEKKEEGAVASGKDEPASKKTSENRNKQKKEKSASSLQSMLQVSKLVSSSEGVVQRIKLNSDAEVKFRNVNKPTEENEKKKPAGKVDSFFQSVDADSDEEGEESADDDEDLPILNYPKGEKGSTRDVGRSRSYQSEGRGFGNNYKNKFNEDRRAEKPTFRKQFPSKGSDGKPGDLHPSWAAKRSSQGQFNAKPQGKRTVFGNNDRRTENSSTSRKQFPPKGPEGIPEDLHPSWAAKRLKSEQLNAKPQGKRTVFGDDDKKADKPPPFKKQFPSKGSNDIPADLHPSWAAKLLKKEKDAAKSQGKRTVFGDD